MTDYLKQQVSNIHSGVKLPKFPSAESNTLSLNRSGNILRRIIMKPAIFWVPYVPKFYASDSSLPFFSSSFISPFHLLPPPFCQYYFLDNLLKFNYLVYFTLVLITMVSPRGIQESCGVGGADGEHKQLRFKKLFQATIYTSCMLLLPITNPNHFISILIHFHSRQKQFPILP